MTCIHHLPHSGKHPPPEMKDKMSEHYSLDTLLISHCRYVILIHCKVSKHYNLEHKLFCTDLPISSNGAEIRWTTTEVKHNSTLLLVHGGPKSGKICSLAGW